MRTLLCLLLCLLCLSPVHAESEAEAIGKKLLAQIDAGEYMQAYKVASKLMTAQVDADKFSDGIKAAKKQVGVRKSRAYSGAQAKKSLPGAEGDFMILSWKSSFKNLPSATELIVLSREDGEWKLAGYSIIR